VAKRGAQSGERQRQLRFCARRRRSVYDDFGLTGLPETYFLDWRGRIVAHVLGEISPTQIEDGVRAARTAVAVDAG
jgi:hypothetical protein